MALSWRQPISGNGFLIVRAANDLLAAGNRLCRGRYLVLSVAFLSGGRG
jgi:hypothetical protein